MHEGELMHSRCDAPYKTDKYDVDTYSVIIHDNYIFVIL